MVFKEILITRILGKNLESSSVEARKAEKKSVYVALMCCMKFLRSQLNIQFFSLL